MKNHILTAVAALMMASPAMAQNTTTTNQTNQAPAATTTGTGSQAGGMEADSQGGMTMGTTSTVAVRFVDVSPADIMASRLDDLDVYNNNNENIGEIEDFVIRDGKTITGVVVSVGGFLGIGDRYVLLDPSSIVLHDQDGDLRAMVNTSKEELNSAPEFEYTDTDD